MKKLLNSKNKGGAPKGNSNAMRTGQHTRSARILRAMDRIVGHIEALAVKVCAVETGDLKLFSVACQGDRKKSSSKKLSPKVKKGLRSRGKNAGRAVPRATLESVENNQV